jgi:hypothetical protein
VHDNNIRNSLCSYFYLKLAKRHVSLIIFYVFSFTKLENRRVEQVGRWAPMGGGRWQERGRRINMVQITYTHVYKCKNDTC